MAPLVRLTDIEHAGGEVVEIWNRAQPQEPLSPSEVGRILAADPGLVLVTPDRSGVLAATLRSSTSGRRGHVRLIAVDDARRRQGVASQLLDAAIDWMVRQGATSLRWGAEAPWYLWPGIDAAWDAALALAAHRGARQTGEAVNLCLTTDFHIEPPAGVTIERLTSAAHHADMVAAARELVGRNWPPWLVEFDLAVESGTLFVAFAGSEPLAFMAHSTLRHGWLGPMGTDPEHQSRGVGAATMSAACADLAQRGVDTAQIAWVGPVSYFTRLGARPCRTFRQMAQELPQA